MEVKFSNEVRQSLANYEESLKHYPIPMGRAKQKADNMVAALMALGNHLSPLSICMNKDLLQVFDNAGNPIYKDLKRFNYKDESNFQWAFACLYDQENDTITILKMMPSSFITKESRDSNKVVINESKLRKIIRDVIKESLLN